MDRVMVMCKEGPLDGIAVSVDADVEAFSGVNDMPENSRYVRNADTLRDLRSTDKADVLFTGHPITQYCEFTYENE